MVYRFFPEAQDYVNDVKDDVKIGVPEAAEAIIKIGDKNDSDDEREPVKSPIGTKFIDQHDRLSLSLSRPILGRMEGQIFIPVELSLAV